MKIAHVSMVLLCSLIWGANIIMMKLGMEVLSPMLFALLRFSLLFLVMLPWLKVIPGQMVNLVLVGLLSGGLHFIALFLSVDKASSLSAISVVSQTTLPFSLLMAFLLLKEKVGPWRLGGISVAFAGIVLITFDPALADNIEASLIMIAGTFSYSLSMILMRRLKGVGVFTMQAWLAVVSIPVLLLATLVFEQGQMEQLDRLPAAPMALTAVLYSAIMASVVAHGSLYFLFQRYPVAYVSPWLMMAPIFSIIFAVILFDESLTMKLVLGTVLTFGGMGLIYFRDWWRIRAAKKILAATEDDTAVTVRAEL